MSLSSATGRWARRFLFPLLLLGQMQPWAADQASDQFDVPTGGAACIVAKWQGNSLDYALVTGKSHPSEAIEEAERILSDKGYASYKKNVDVRHTQATALYPRGYVMVVKTTYRTTLGKDRTSYGCGFSMRSYEQALGRALVNLQSYSWGWKPGIPFDVVEFRQYP